ncbi:MAG: hypothetical protein L0Y44_11550 [Phycisphaerales bacterium]|nr:hypothetical protein [Phycisphaerales bacterium]
MDEPMGLRYRALTSDTPSSTESEPMYPNTATVHTYLLIHLGVIAVVCAYYALSAAMAPHLTERARLRFAKRPWLPALIGIGVSLPWVVASLVLMSLPMGGAKFAGATLGLLWILCGLIGGAAIAQHVGQGAATSEAWVRSVRGGLFITLTWVLPLVGWLIMIPLTLASGIGCLIVGLVPSRQQALAA